MIVSWPVLGGLIGWATLAGLDLASVLQALLSRPLVVGAGAGWIMGDIDAGLRVGALLELFALDVVPVGSSRYPDFGAATVAAVVVAAAAGPWRETLGAATGLGLALATLAGASLPVTRRLNARTVRAYAERMAAGDDRAVRAVHWAGFRHDTVRSVAVAVATLTVAITIRWLGVVPRGAAGSGLTVVAGAGAAWAVAHGAVASGRSGPRWRWALAGLAAGLGAVVAW